VHGNNTLARIGPDDVRDRADGRGLEGADNEPDDDDASRHGGDLRSAGA
jgi:hypothetical protein